MSVFEVIFTNSTPIQEVEFDSKKSANLPLLKDLNQKFIPAIQTFLTLSSFKQLITEHKCTKSDCFHCEIRKLFDTDLISTKYISCGTLQNFIEIHSIHLEESEGISNFLNMIHGNDNKICHPKCELHQAFPIFKRELSCDCGAFFGALANDMLTSLKIPLKQLIKPFNSRMGEFNAINIMAIADISTLRSLRFQFANVIKNAFQTKKPSFFKCPSAKNHEPAFNIKSTNTDPSLLVLKFNWNNVEQNTFNAMQSLMWLDGQFNLSEFSSCPPSKNLSLKTIFLTKNDKGKTITFINNSWYKLSTKRNFQIHKGKWLDTLFYIISHRYIPHYAFYEKIDAPPIIKLEPIEIGYIERVSYLAELGENLKGGLSKAYYYLDHGFLSSSNMIMCLNCHKMKVLGEACEACGFINGDWNCSKCLEFNKQILWTCRNCRADRINVDYDYYCEECFKTSTNLSFCKYCPPTICFICGKEMFSYEEIFCTVCKYDTIPFHECSSSNNSVLCSNCKSFAE
ncbi:hypothetical protein SteCoe_28903 [Stentor coeruleus]|uniref:RanBP2-type domain-containing protein n=1 Tax=Stentor coeruleus TaxID=5963 RepID=A0A1R2B7H3_9CILI|nr:hypothetical protein SteCoe_28903 [Stentor coeruleus]